MAAKKLWNKTITDEDINKMVCSRLPLIDPTVILTTLWVHKLVMRLIIQYKRRVKFCKVGTFTQKFAYVKFDIENDTPFDFGEWESNSES